MRLSLFFIIAFAISITGIILRTTMPAAPSFSHTTTIDTPVVSAQTTAEASRTLPSLPEIKAESAAVVDGKTGVLLGEKNNDAVFSIASITKLMTALVFLDTYPDFDRVVRIERGDYRPGGTLFLGEGERVTVRDLFFAMLVGSANNAAVALARTSASSDEEFVGRMNERALAMGLSATHFVEPTGLERGNTASALDLVRLAWYAFRDPIVREALTTKEYTFITQNTKRRHRVKTTDDLLLDGKRDYTIIGAKTGFTDEAGYTFVIAAERAGQSVLVALLRAPTEASRFTDADRLIRWAFAIAAP